MKILKRIIVVFSVAFCLVALCACGANVDYYYSSDGENIKTEYVLTLPTALKDELNGTAATDASFSVPAAWTLERYLYELGANFGFNVSNVSAGDKFTCRFSKTISASDMQGSDDDDEKLSYEVENHFFTRRVTATQDNVFNGIYDDYARKGDTNTLMTVIAEGYRRADGREILPAFTSAFPAANNYDAKDITLRFLWRVGKNSDIKPENGEIITENGERYMVWDAKFDSEERKIIYSYSVVNPLGYYVVTLIVGLVVVGIILLVTIKSRKQPKMAEMKTGPVHYYGQRRGNNNGNNNGSVVYYGDMRRNDTAAQARRELDELFGTSESPAPDKKEQATEINDVFGGENDEDNEKRTK